jgi:hypothetical protein
VSAQNFTPGPWVAANDPSRTNRRERMALVITPSGRMAIDCTNSGDTYKEDCANAHLISAAPDLYAAAKRIAEFAVSWTPLSNGDIADLCKAVAKAEGREAKS